MIRGWELQHGFDFVDERFGVFRMFAQSEDGEHEKLARKRGLAFLVWDYMCRVVFLLLVADARTQRTRR